jgi:outer membrane lipoprotein-sorting protein
MRNGGVICAGPANSVALASAVRAGLFGRSRGRCLPNPRQAPHTGWRRIPALNDVQDTTTAMKICSSLFVMMLGLVSGAACAITADELIAKNISARGGLERIKAIQSVRYTGKLALSGDFTAEFALVRQIRRPNLIRSDATLQGLTMVRAWDGQEGWGISPLFGRKDPERLSPDESKELIEMADIDGPLVDSASKGYRVEYLGTEDVDGTEAHKLKVTAMDGDVQYVYLDPDYFLVIRVLYQRFVRGAQVDVETDLGNYEKVNGVYFPFSIDAGPKGGAKTRKITIERMDANVPLKDEIFRFPGGGK